MNFIICQAERIKEALSDLYYYEKFTYYRLNDSNVAKNCGGIQ